MEFNEVNLLLSSMVIRNVIFNGSIMTLKHMSYDKQYEIYKLILI